MFGKVRWPLILVVMFLVMPTIASASVFSDAQYKKNQFYNLRTTVKGGTTVYGTFTQSILRRPVALPDGVNAEVAEKLNIDGLDSTDVTPVVSGNVQSVKTQDVTLDNDNPAIGNNPLLINSHANFEPAKSFGGLGYNLKTEVKNGDTLYATNRMALLSNPFAAIFGSVFAGECTQDTSDLSSKSCRKLNFGQKGIGTTENNFGGANFSYQIPGYYIQKDSILKWDPNNNYGNSTMGDVITELERTAFRRTCHTGGVPITYKYTYSLLGFANATSTNPLCNLAQLDSSQLDTSGRVVVFNGDLILRPSTALSLWGIGTVIVRGDLTIDGNVKYPSSDPSSSSVGFIVLGKDGQGGGQIRITTNASTVQGMFYASGLNGKIIIESGSSRLVAKGVFATTTFELNKRTGVIDNNTSVPDGEDLNNAGIINTNTNYNVAILYDPRIQSNPPPGFKYGVTSTSPSNQSLFEPAAP